MKSGQVWEWLVTARCIADFLKSNTPVRKILDYDFAPVSFWCKRPVPRFGKRRLAFAVFIRAKNAIGRKFLRNPERIKTYERIGIRKGPSALLILHRS